MDRNALIFALVVGTLIQLSMIVIGHFVPVVRDKVFMIGGLLISLIAGLIYAKLAAGTGWPMALAGGVLVGGACALIGIGASVAWGDTAPFILVAGTLSSAVTGAIGGAIGKLLA